MNATLLSDKSRLNEIFEFRVEAWEHSPGKHFINRKYFPTGWMDKLDESAYHWIIEQDHRIIASARLCVLSNFEDMSEDFSVFDIPHERPFAFFSRLVVHQDFRKKGLPEILDRARIQFIIDNKIGFTLAYSTQKRLNALVGLGFKSLGSHVIANNVTPNENKFYDTGIILYYNDINL